MNKLIALLLLASSSHSHAVVPTAPSNLTATAVSPTQVNLSWQDNSNNETGFHAKRLLNGSYPTIGTVGTNVTTYSDTTVNPGTTYSYKVQAYNNTGGALSNVATVTTPTATPTPTPTPPPQNTYYVDPINGNDGNNGSQAAPWRTIQKSMNAATAGSVVNIKAGTYHERLSLGVSGTAGNVITFQPLGYTGTNCGASIAANGYVTCTGDQVIVDYAYLGTVTNDSTPFFSISGRNYATIQGLTFQNYTCDGAFKQGVRIDGGSHDVRLLNNRFLNNKNIHGVFDNTSALLHIRVWGSNNITIKGNELGNIWSNASEALTLDTGSTNALVESNYVHDTDAIGIDINNGANNATFRGNLLEYIGKKRDGTVWYNNPTIGVYVQGGNTSTVERNIVRDSEWAYMALTEPGYPATHDITFRDNLAYRNDQGALMLGNWYSTDGSSVYNIKVLNNTAYDNLHGIYIRPYTAASVSWKNNILSSNTNNYVVDAGSPGTLDYNLYFGGNSGPDAHKVTTNPLFTNPTAPNADLSLQATSPARDAGDPGFVLGSGETDFAGNNRVGGGRVDIGAYEVQ